MKPERNDPCPCGSGKTFEKCCLDWYESANGKVFREKPTAPECNQLLVLFNAGHNAELETQARLLLERCSDSGFIWNLLGISLQRQSKDGLPAFQKAVCFLPDNAEAHSNLGNALSDLGLLDEAEASYRMAISLNPDFADVYGNLGGMLMVQGKLNEALTCFQQQAKLTPESSSIRHLTKHLIASLNGNNTERAPAEYIEGIFDSYAEKFDTHLRQTLKYETPEKLVALVTQHSTLPDEKWNVLDLGCGTGLAGAAISSFARQLTGVDLSSKMLEKAHARNLYQRLEHLDLLTMMQAEKNSSYDIIIAADVFVYIGKLDKIISEIKRLLCPGGILAFSVEALGAFSNKETNQDAQREYQLENTGRYSHSINYVSRLAAVNGFLPVEIAATQLRMEQNKPVMGHLVLWKN